jgi:hypothetical protein
VRAVCARVSGSVTCHSNGRGGGGRGPDPRAKITNDGAQPNFGSQLQLDMTGRFYILQNPRCGQEEGGGGGGRELHLL